MKALVSRKSIALTAALLVFTDAIACSQEKRALLKGVVENQLKKPVGGALVTIEGFKEGVRTDNQGQFEIKYMPGQFVLRISVPGYVPDRKPLILNAPDVVELETTTLIYLPAKNMWAGLLSVYIKQEAEAFPTTSGWPGVRDPLQGIEVRTTVGDVEALPVPPGGNPRARMAVHATYHAAQEPFLVNPVTIAPGSPLGLQIDTGGSRPLLRPLGATWTSDFHIVLSYVPNSRDPSSIFGWEWNAYTTEP
jgi:hypothetical protein